MSSRLSLERSPYLLQHARNPVDRHPWRPEAFEQAKREEPTGADGRLPARWRNSACTFRRKHAGLLKLLQAGSGQGLSTG